jgi:hypothetical protein
LKLKTDEEIYNELKNILEFLVKIPSYHKEEVGRDLEPLMIQFSNEIRSAKMKLERIYFIMFPNGDFQEIDLSEIRKRFIEYFKSKK